jgi:hypothetical protein
MPVAWGPAMKKMLYRARTFSAVMLVAVLLLAFVPRQAGAGGCDDPAYVGGVCASSSDVPVVGVPPDKTPARPKHPRNSLRYLQSWLLTFLTGLVR